MAQTSLISVSMLLIALTDSQIGLAEPVRPAPLRQASGAPALFQTPNAGIERKFAVNRPLLVTGTAVLLASYAPALFVGLDSDRAADRNLVYPVVGPWLNLADRKCEPQTCNGEATKRALLVADGVGQGLGVVGMLASVLVPGKSAQKWYFVGSDRLHLEPAGVGIAGGLAAAGVF